MERRHRLCQACARTVELRAPEGPPGDAQDTPGPRRDGPDVNRGWDSQVDRVEVGQGWGLGIRSQGSGGQCKQDGGESNHLGVDKVVLKL